MKFLNMFFKSGSNNTGLYVGLFLKETSGIVYFIKTDSQEHKIIAKKGFHYSNGWENIVEDMDSVLYTLETQVNISPDQAIFFIYSHLLNPETHEIKEPYLSKIRQVSKNLEFKPLGYIECHQAISESLGKTEKTPLNAVLIEVDKTSMGIFAYRGGRLDYEEIIPKTGEPLADILPVLEKIKAKFVLPPRIILYDARDVDVELSALASHRWTEELFVQIPKATVLPEETLAAALLAAFHHQVKGELQKEHAVEKSHGAPSVMGFAVGHDIEKKPVAHTSQKITRNFQFPQIGKFIQSIKIPPIFRKGHLPIALGILIIVAGLFFMEYQFHTAEVTVYFPSQKIEKKLAISDLTFAPRSTTTTLSDSKTTTGKKEVGERASGPVTIFNSSLTESKTISRGTVLRGPDNLNFTLDSDVKVASASGDASSVTSGSAKTTVVASEIGSESNLSSNTKFTIADQPSDVVIAKSTSGFTGGSKRQIQTVASRDHQELTDEVMKKAKSFMHGKVVPSYKKGTRLVPSLTRYELQSPTFSKEVGEEAGEVRLSSKVKITVMSYRQSAMAKEITDALKKDATNDMVIREDKINYTITDAKENKNGYTLQTDVSVRLTPNVNEDEIEQIIIAKNAVSLPELLKEKYGVSGFEIDVHHPIGFLRSLTPVFKKNISLKVSYL